MRESKRIKEEKMKVDTGQSSRVFLGEGKDDAADEE